MVPRVYYLVLEQLFQGEFFYTSPRMESIMLEIKNVCKTFNKNGLHALKQINLQVLDGEIFGIIGLSGAGKSTLLRSIIGLTKVDSGTITVDDVNVQELDEKNLRIFRRKIGVVFQGYNLLYQRNVFDNVALPLRLVKYPKDQIEEKVKQLLALVGLVDKEKSYPSQLSGGEQQRVAIARALIMEPKILLLDEITSALDPLTTKQILQLLKEINERLNVTIIFITHEMGVVASICNKVAVLNYGEIVESGSAKEILNSPKSDIAKMLLGKEEVI